MNKGESALVKVNSSTGQSTEISYTSCVENSQTNFPGAPVKLAIPSFRASSINKETELGLSRALSSIYAWRASQLDASEIGELLFNDQRLYALCKWNNNSAFFSEGRVKEILCNFVRPFIEFWSLGTLSKCTIGQQILGIQFESPTPISKLQRLIYVLSKYALPNWLQKRQGENSHKPKVRILVRALNLLLFCRFLGTGACQDVAEWLAGLHVASHRISSFTLAFDWMERQLVIEAVARTIELASKLWPNIKWKRQLKSSTSNNDECPVCKEPFHWNRVQLHPCKHSFCHWCCWEAKSSEKCAICSNKVVSIHRK
jgi:hypothetical protein